MRVLTFADWYLPGFRAGGPVRTLANLVDRVGDRVAFSIVTRDHDCDGTPYDTIVRGRWNDVGRARVLYVSSDAMGGRELAGIVRDVAPDLLYLNSVFSPFSRRVLEQRRWGALRGMPILLASRGEFAPAALARKGMRKRLFLAASRPLGLYDGIVWQSSSEYERDDILRVAGPRADVAIVADVASPLPPLDPRARAVKSPGVLRLAFLSRIAGMKNPVYLIERLAALRGNVTLDVWGPLEEPAVWDACLTAAKRLPAGVHIERKGEVPPGDVSNVLQRYHAFALPTLGENFGHVILEAFAAGCPVVVSDRTPWRGLAASGAGWDIPLEDPASWERALQDLVDLDERGWSRHTAAARARAAGWIDSEDLAPAIALFEKAARAQR